MASSGFGLACLGCLGLSLSLRRHYRQVFGSEVGYERRRGWLRGAGFGLAVLALWPAAAASGLPVGLTLWISQLALAAFLQILLLSYRPGAAAAFAGLGVALVALGLLP